MKILECSQDRTFVIQNTPALQGNKSFATLDTKVYVHTYTHRYDEYLITIFVGDTTYFISSLTYAKLQYIKFVPLGKF